MKKRLTQAEFEHAISNPNKRTQVAANVEIVKAILVDGRKQNDMVIETGLSRTAIAAMTKKVREAHKLHGKPPAGWERIELCIPSSMVPMFIQSIRKPPVTRHSMQSAFSADSRLASRRISPVRATMGRMTFGRPAPDAAAADGDAGHDN